MKILSLALLASFAYAADMPVPKVFKGMQGQKGQYQVEVLESAGKSAGQKMTICTDNLMKPPAEGKGKSSSQSSCKQKILKDTADEAVIESTCDDRKSTVSVKRENAKTLLMSVQSDTKKGPQTMKMRYTHIGACREGQGSFSLDPNSEECKSMRQQAAQMKDRAMADRLMSMCK